MRKLKLFVAALTLLLGGVNSAWAQTDVTASYIGDLNLISGSNGEPYKHLESDGKGWWNNQTTGLTGWHAFVKNGDAYESWTGSFGGAGVMIGRTMVLPEGNYTLSFEAFACNATNSAEPTALPSAGDAVAFLTGESNNYANNDITNTTAAGDATFHTVSYTFDVTTANTAYEFGIKKLTDESKIDWCQIKNVKLLLNSTNITAIDNSNVNSFVYNGNQDWHTNTWSVEGQSDGTRFQVPFHELWVGSGNTLSDATITGTYTPTQNGVYKVTAWVRAMNEAGGDISGVKIFVGDAEADACTGTSARDGKARIGTFSAMADGVSGTPFNYGFKIENATLNWLSFKNVTITYYAEMPEAEKAALLASVPTGKMNATVQEQLNTYKSNFESNASVANYNALSLYIPTAQASVDVYTAINTAISECTVKGATLDASGGFDISAIQTKYDEGTYETLAEAESELQAALKLAALSQTNEGANMTLALVNPSFETANSNGWTIESTGNNVNIVFPNTTAFTKKDGTYFAERYQPNGTIEINQTVTVKTAGVYKVEVSALARGDVSSAKLYANTVDTPITIVDAANDYATSVALDANSDLKIGFNAVATANGGNSWIAFDNFKLTYTGGLPDVTAVEGKMNASVAETQTAAIAAYNENKTVANYNAASAAIAAAQASKEAYAAANAAITKAEAILAETNVFVAADKTTYETAVNEAKTAYENGEMEDATASALENTLNGGTNYKPSVPMRNFYGSAWSATNSVNVYANSWSTEGNSDLSNFTVPFIEDWVSDANKLANTTISASVSDLSAGTYKVTAKVRLRLNNNGTAPVSGVSMQASHGDAVAVSGTPNYGSFYVADVEATGYVTEDNGTLTINFIVDGTNASWLGIKAVNYERTGDVPAADADDYAALTSEINKVSSFKAGFENGEYAPYNNIEAFAALAAAKAIDQNVTNVKTIVNAATTALSEATWTANDGDVECVYNGNFAIGQDSPAADIQQYGWTRTNGWGQFRSDSDNKSTSKGTSYYNQPGSLQYGNAGGYTMPLKANTIYSLTFKYASWEDGSNDNIKASVLNGEDGMAEMTFEANHVKHTTENGFVTKQLVFATGAEGNYVLTLANSGNTVITDVSITKATSQVLEFADGTDVPSYAPGTYPAVKVSRSFTANRWATAVYPFSMSFGENAKIAVLDAFEDGTLKFASSEYSTANEPFLIRFAADASELTLGDVNVVAANATNVVKGNATLVGVYTDATVEAASEGDFNYVLSSNKIYLVGDEAATVAPYRAYIQVAAAAAGEARSLRFTVDGAETTGIEGVNVVENENGNVYNLQGQRVVKAQKGLYIVNGKKVVKK